VAKIQQKAISNLDTQTHIHTHLLTITHQQHSVSEHQAVQFDSLAASMHEVGLSSEKI